MKGIVLSDTVLIAITIVISLILIALIANIVFTQQTSRTIDELFKSIGRNTAIAIDRTAALAGSGMIEQEIPKGVKMRMKVDYKSVFITYDGQTIKAPFSGLIHGGPYEFENPGKLCIVKSREDRRVNIVDRECSCNVRNGICDPACVVTETCDPDCYRNEGDFVCNLYCVREGDRICDPDCYRNETDSVFDRDCIDPNNNPDGTCDPDSDEISDGICDRDCFEKYNGVSGVCDPDCKSTDKDGDGMEDQPDGICYAGCVNTTNSIIKLKPDDVCDIECNEENGICDPDCTKDPDCEFKCAKIGEDCSEFPPCPDSGGACCPGTKIVSADCCGNDVCEGRDMWSSGNKTRWETPYTCPADCCEPGTSCPQRPSDCSSRVNMGSFTSNPCYYDTAALLTGGHPYWASDTTQVCHEDVQVFLDRRNWDIKEVARTIVSLPPEGWAFDWSRYFTIRTGPTSCSAQPASYTSTANEEYNRRDASCCSDPSRCPCASCTYRGPECAGVGFCADHAALALSIFRTLGVPADHVYGVFINDPRPGRHAFIVYYCDSSLPENLQLAECEGRWDQWLRIDGTQHRIEPLRNFPCEEMCIWWNDQGPYPKTEGRFNDTHGYPYNLTVDCARTGSNNLPCMYDELCGLLGVGCVCDKSGNACTN